jgi:hypothetical protein
MNPAHVVWPLGRGFWDMAMLEHVFQHRWRPVCAHDFIHHMKFEEVAADVDGVVVVLPARHCDNAGMGAERLTGLLARFQWALILNTGDEESVFHSERIQHPNIKRWQFLPKPGMHDFADRRVINGYPTGVEVFSKYEKQAAERKLDWFFSGQITHLRRELCFQGIRDCPRGLFNATRGFTQGFPHEDYYAFMTSAKVIPCPSGAVMPDSFRVAEALEAGCIPVADGYSPRADYPAGYWKYVLGEEPPFPIIEDWTNFPSILNKLLSEWPANRNRIWAWWSSYKRNLTYAMRDDILALRKNAQIQGLHET